MIYESNFSGEKKKELIYELLGEEQNTQTFWENAASRLFGSQESTETNNPLWCLRVTKSKGNGA